MRDGDHEERSGGAATERGQRRAAVECLGDKLGDGEPDHHTGDERLDALDIVGPYE